MKKLLTIILSLAMVLTMSFIPTFATIYGDADVEDLGGKGSGLQLIDGELANAYGSLQPEEEITYTIKVPFDSVIRFDFFPVGNGRYEVSIPELDYSHSTNCNFENTDDDSVVYQVTSPGTYTVKVKSETYSEDANYCFTVKAYPVNDIPAASVDVLKCDGNLKVGETVKMSCNLDPYYATDEIIWSTSNSKIATVNKKGVVKAKKLGTVTITAKSKISGKKDSTKISITKMDFNMWTSEKPNLKNYVNKISGYKTGKWSSGKTSVAKVSSSGILTPKKSGNTTIKFKCKGKTYIFNVYCYSKKTLRKKAADALRILTYDPDELIIEKTYYRVANDRSGVMVGFDFITREGYIYRDDSFVYVAANRKYDYTFV